MYAMYIHTEVCQKVPVEQKQCQKKFKHASVAIIELRLSECISNAVSQLVSRKFHYLKTTTVS